MLRNEVISRLKSLEPAIRAEGIDALYLYGSYARNEAQDESDIDIFVDPADSLSFGLTALLKTLDILEAKFPGRTIGYGTRDHIVPCFRKSIEQSAVRVF